MAAAGLSLSVDESRGGSLACDGGENRRENDDDDISFETASTSTLLSILSQPPLPSEPPPLRGDEQAARRHRVAQAVHASWTQRGTEPAGLAERFLDGSIDALDELILGGAAAESKEENGNVKQEEEEEEEEESRAKNETDAPRLRSRCLGPRIAVVDASSFSYDDFVSRFMEPGVPVIIKNAAKSWKSYREWGGWKSGKSKQRRRRLRLPLPLALASAASPDARAPIVDCDAGHRTEENVREFARRWARLERGGGGEEEGGERLYLKDWHFCRPASSSSSPSSTSAPLEGGGGESWYTVPPWFSDDWLNGAVLAGVSLRGGGGGEGAENDGDGETNIGKTCESGFDDYRFIYAGPAATSTPLHADVLSTCSWSANVAGRKRWRLLPPERTHFLFDRFGRELAPDFFSSSAAFPLLRFAPRHVTEATQEAGDAIFVPPGWHHTVENLGTEDEEEEAEEDDDGDDDKSDDGGEKSDDENKNSNFCGGAISINHNWFNAHSLRWVFELLRSERRSAADAIEDCRSTTTPVEFESLVQRNLGASAGMDFAGLARVCEWACERAETRCEGLLMRTAKRSGDGDNGEEKQQHDDDSSSPSQLLAQVLSCRLDATRARSAAEALAEDLSLSFSCSPSSCCLPSPSSTLTTATTAPAFVAEAIERALIASHRALRAAERAEGEIGKSRALGREH